MQKRVQLSHVVVSRSYYGSNAGWSTTVHSKEVGKPYAIDQKGETIQLICHVDGCEAKLTFRLTPEEEHKQFFRSAFKRHLMMLGAALAIAGLGALTERVSNDIVALQVIGFVLISIGEITSFILLALLAFGGRAKRYDLTYESDASLRTGVQHGVEFL